MPYAILEARDEKNRQGSEIPLRPDLAADLSGWLADRLEAARRQAKASGDEIPTCLPSDAKLFNVPIALVKILDRDLVAAGIARKVVVDGKVKIIKRDARGFSVDVHALRTTFGTHLSKGGVSLRTAQAAMRHSDPALTANVYTDPKLLDVAGAMNALPLLTLKATKASTPEVMKATGTDGKGGAEISPTEKAASLPHAREARSEFAPEFAPTLVKPVQIRGTPDTMDAPDYLPDWAYDTDVSADSDNASDMLADTGKSGRWRTRTVDLLGVSETL